MELILSLFILWPTLGFLISLLMPEKAEKGISRLASVTYGVHFLGAFGFVSWWIFKGAPTINVKEIMLYDSEAYTFFIDLFFDKVTAFYLMLSSSLTYLISVYSRAYLHRERGYKRFFNTILLFFLGIQIIIFSGNFETLFVGWEILGLSSFLLIAFYSDRYLPVKNAMKVFSIYRVADIGILLTMWLSHHLWHENITFLQLNNSELVHSHLVDHGYIGFVISMAILLAASAKSAQFPFSSWLPRAMEGPTPSSAIFYGSLAVHIGVFLLLRTYPFWEEQTLVKVMIIGLGIVTSFTANISARVQSSVKAQIAYSSIAQIGLIFIEVALGWDWVALIHLCGNAYLRAYQLLVSPSVVAYLVREQFYTLNPVRTKEIRSWKRILGYSMFVIGLKEWKLDPLMYKWLWNPLKKTGKLLSFITVMNVSAFSLIVFVVFIYLIMNGIHLPSLVEGQIPELFSLIALLLVIRAFIERKEVFLSWLLLILSHFWIALAVAMNETFSISHIIFYLSGVVVAGVVGYFILLWMQTKESFDLNDFYGHSYEYPKIALAFLLSALALAGFPITTTFLGEDLIFSHIQATQIVLAVFVSLNFIVQGLALIRMFSRIFLGPHKKAYHASANRSA